MQGREPTIGHPSEPNQNLYSGNIQGGQLSSSVSTHHSSSHNVNPLCAYELYTASVACSLRTSQSLNSSYSPLPAYQTSLSPSSSCDMRMMSSIPQSQKDSTTSQVGDHQQHHGSSLNPPQNATRNYLLDPGVMDNNGRLQRWPVHVQHFPQQWHVQATTSHMHASRSSDYAQPPADFDINVYPAGPRYTGKPKTSEKIGRTSKSIGKFALQAIDNAIVFATRVSILTDAIVKAVACLFDRLTSHRRDSSAVPRADLRLQQSPTDAMLVYSPLRPGSEPVWCLQTSSVPVSMHQVQVAPGARLYRDLKGAEDLPEGGNTLTFELIQLLT